MFKHCFFLVVLFLSLGAYPRPLVIYTSDSLAGKGSWGAVLKFLYEEKFPGKKIELVTFPSVGEAVNQVILEGKTPKADILLGIDNSMYPKIAKKGLLESLPLELTVNLTLPVRDGVVVPFNYGYLAIVYDSRRRPMQKPSVPLMQLSTDSSYRKKLVIEDPRTSSLGASFLLFTHKVLNGVDFRGFWAAMEKQLFRLPPSWTSAYGLFTNGDADLVLSYTTSPAYHMIHEKKDFYRVVLFDEGQFLQWEGAAVLAKAQEKAQALELLKIALSEPAQKEIPLTNWMYPVLKGVKLPAEFERLPKPSKIITSDEMDEGAYRQTLQTWERIYTGKGK